MNNVGEGPLGLPIGIQLYTVQAELDADFDGTLRKIAEIGYKAVETANFDGKSLSGLRKSLDDAGLDCPSAHFIPLMMTPDQITAQINFCQELGIRYMVSAAIFPPEVASLPQDLSSEERMGQILAMLDNISFDLVKQSADRYNAIGEQTRKAGIQFAHHNHSFEFKDYDGISGMEYLFQNTDRDAVKFELDCGWTVHAGHDPVAMIKKYPDRIRMLHVRDEKPGYQPTTSLIAGAPPTEVGRGVVDWPKVFAAAKEAKIEHYFVEQNPPYQDMPALEAIQVSYDYLRELKSRV